MPRPLTVDLGGGGRGGGGGLMQGFLFYRLDEQIITFSFLFLFLSCDLTTSRQQTKPTPTSASDLFKCGLKIT